MLKMRIIPCLDVKDGRVVKGVNFVDLRDAGDPVEAAAAYDEARAPTSSAFLDITAQPRKARHHPRRRAPHRRAMLHAAHRGRRRAHAWTTSATLLRAGADKVSINTAAVQRPATSSARAAELRQPVHRGRHRRQARDRAGRIAALGSLHPRRPQPHRHRRRGLVP